MLNFIQYFFCVYWDGHMIFIFQFFNVIYLIDSFAYVDPILASKEYISLYHGVQSSYSTVEFSLQIFLKIFCISMLKDAYSLEGKL